MYPRDTPTESNRVNKSLDRTEPPVNNYQNYLPGGVVEGGGKVKGQEPGWTSFKGGIHLNDITVTRY